MGERSIPCKGSITVFYLCPSRRMLLFPWRAYCHYLKGDCCYSLAMGKGEYYYSFKGGSTTIPLWKITNPFEGILSWPCMGESSIPCKGSITIYAHQCEGYYSLGEHTTTTLAVGKGEYYYSFKGWSATIPLEGVLLCPCMWKSSVPCKGSTTMYANHGECYFPI